MKLEEMKVRADLLKSIEFEKDRVMKILQIKAEQDTENVTYEHYYGVDPA